MRFQNKEILKSTVLAFGKRAEQVDDGVAHEAEILAKKNKDSGVDRTSRKEAVAAKKAEVSAARLRKRKAKAAAAAERAEKTAASNTAPNAGSKPRKKFPTAESQAARALISNPARPHLGKFDLTAKIPASKEELTEECEARGIAPANGAQLRAKPKGPEANVDPKLTVKALVLLLKPHSDGQGLLKIISQTASGTGRFQRGDRVRLAPCKAPEQALPFRSEERASEVAFSSTSVPAIPGSVAASAGPPSPAVARGGASGETRPAEVTPAPNAASPQRRGRSGNLRPPLSPETEARRNAQRRRITTSPIRAVDKDA